MSICLSRTSGLSREQRSRKTKIGTEVAHVTRDSDTSFKVKRSKVNLQGAVAILRRPPAQLVMFKMSTNWSTFTEAAHDQTIGAGVGVAASADGLWR